MIRQEEGGYVYFGVCDGGCIKATEYCLDHDESNACLKYSAKRSNFYHIQKLIEWKHIPHFDECGNVYSGLGF